MQIFKRGLSFLLSLVVIFSMVPAVARAEEEPQTQVSSGDVTVEGTNSLGTLLSEDVEEYRQTDETAGGYNVVDLTFENGVATAEFRTLETAILMVAVYTEDGVQLVTSGYAQVQPEDSTVSVTMSGEMPQYFVAAAYLVDVYDHSPLCTAYETVMYTQEMQELLASTVDDYDPELVLNLDDSTETNFAVYEENTVVIEEQTGVNTVASVDDENAVYVIENADESITSLVAGDIFVLPYDEDNILIVKVASISVDGTTAIVTGADVDLKEVFSCMKIESTGQTEDLVVDETTGDEEVTYVGMIEESEPALRNSSGDYTGKLNLGFEFKQKSGSVSYSGSLNVNINVGFSYYISVSKQQIKLTVDTKTNLSFKFGGKIEFEKKLPSLKFSPIPAVSVGFEPKVVFKISAEIEFVASVVNKTGFSYEKGKGVQNLSTAPKIELDINAKGTVFFGIDFAPTAGILKGKIAELKLSALAGVELTGKMCGTLYDGVTVMGGEPEKSIHDCESCLEVKIQGKIEMKLSLEFLNMSFLKVEFKLTEKVFEIGACYYSFDQQKFGWGECPNVSYRVTVLVKNANNEIVEDVEVYAQWIDQMIELPMGSTNSAGTTVDYLTGGTYTFTATVDGETLERTVKIGKACKVDLNKYTVDLTGFLPGTEADSVMDAGILASGTCGDDLTWKLDHNGTLTIFGTGAMTDWNSYRELPWYSNRSSVKKVVLNDGVTSIGKCAFAHCSNLTAITIPKGVTSIGDAAFSDCTKLTTATLPNSVNYIGESAFYRTNIESVVIPEGVTVINPYTFYYCTNLKSVVIPDGVTAIGNGAFYACSSLTSVTIPDSVTSIGSSAFYDGAALTGIWVGANNANYCSDSKGVLYNKEKTVLLRAPGKLVGSYTIPDGVTSLEPGCFSGCENMTSVMIPESVTSIGASAFRDCRELTSVTIPDGVTGVGSYGFYGCVNMNSVTIPESLTSIGDYAFASCYNLTEICFNAIKMDDLSYRNCAFLWAGNEGSGIKVMVGAQVTKIPAYLFWPTQYEQLSKLVAVEFEAGSVCESIGKCAFAHCSNLTAITIPDGVTSIGNAAFTDCTKLTTVSIPNSVNYIGGSAFYRTNIESVVIPEGVTVINPYTFYYCTNLKSVVIPDGVTAIGDGAFYACSSLTSVTIPDSVTSIGSSAFYDGAALTGIWIGSNNANYCSDSKGVLYNKEKTVLLQAPGKMVGSYTIPDGVTSLEPGCFSGCKTLTSVMIPESVTSIGASAFRNCRGLTSVTIPSGVTSIGNYAFYSCYNLTDINYNAISVEDLSSYNYVFLGAGEESDGLTVTIGTQVTKIPAYLFYPAVYNGISNLTAVEFEAGSVCKSIGKVAFANCRGLSAISIPESVTSIDEWAFEDCSGLTMVKFEGNAPSIEGNCFIGVTASAYYPAGNSTWTTDVLQNYGGTITWVSYDPAVGVPVSAVAVASTEETQENAVAGSTVTETKSPATRGVFGGEYDTQVTDSYTLKTASFSGLVAGEEYLLLALVSMEVEEPLTADNILYVDQGQAGEDGTLVFTYAQRVNTNISYVMACGASNKNLEAAEITFPFMAKTDLTKAVDPVVTYEDQVLTEGVDYTIVGTVDYTAAGTYTCYVRGIYNYTGLVECTYTVVDATVTETEDQTRLQLNEDCEAVLTLDKDLYVDLNGFDMTGTITTGGYKVYGMDSTTDSYSCDALGYFSCTDEEGKEIVPVQHFKTDSKRYMAICDENGYSFHRFYLGITHMSLKPTTSGVGYKAVFWGDEMVASNLDSFGFTMCLEGNDPITAELSAEKFISGKVITLRIDNYDVERYGETVLSACVMLTLADGTVICGTEQTMTLRGMLEQLNESYAVFTEAQLAAVKDFLSRYPITQSWKTENLT